jgi:uncharacterized protein involved in exopolysaccharide biosynthesis
MEELAIFDVLRRRIWMIVTLAIAAAAAAYVGSFFYPAKYSATALVLVRPHQEVRLDSQNSSKEFLGFPMSAANNIETPSKTYIEIIKSPALLSQLVHQLDLDKIESERGMLSRHLPDWLKTHFDSLKQLITNSVSFIIYGKIIPKDSFADAVKSVLDNLTLESRPETYIFSIKYTAKNAELAVKVANSIGRLFISYMDALGQAEGRYDLDRLQLELDKRRRHLEKTRENLQDFKKKHAIFRYETEYDSQLKVISELQIELAKLDESSAGLAAISSQNNSSSSGISLEAKRQNIINQLQSLKAQLEPLPEVERQLNQLQLAERIALATFETVEKEYQARQIKDAYAARDVQLVAEAVPPQVPDGPTRPIFALVGFLSALLLGSCGAFVLEYLDNSVRGIHDVEELLGIKVLTTIPRVTQFRAR